MINMIYWIIEKINKLIGYEYKESELSTQAREAFLYTLLEHDVTDYQVSEETESGVFGIHIVFEKKK